MYYGCIAPHWRVGTYKGEHFIQTFLHWVSRGRYRLEFLI